MPVCNGRNHKGEHRTQVGIVQWRHRHGDGHHFSTGRNPNEGHLPTVVVVDLKHYRGPVWDEDNPTHVPILPMQRRCEPRCCTIKQIQLQIAWAKTIHSLQGHNAGPTAKHQTPNDIQRIVSQLGERTDLTLNQGLTYVVVSIATTIGDLGHMTSIPRKYTNSALYFRADSFPAGIKRLTHSFSTGDECVKVKQRTAWVAYLDARQEQTSIITVQGDKDIVQEWMENKKYSREDILAVVRNNEWRKMKQYMFAETSKPPLTRRQKDMLLYPIPRNLSALLITNELMAGSQIEELLSHLVSSSTNMPLTGTDFGPCLIHQGQLYWDNLMGTRRVNSAQRARDVKDVVKHILYIPWFTGETTGGHWSLIVRSKSTHGKVAFYHMDSFKHFDNSASYALPNTPVYSHNRDSWHNVMTVRQTELECGMRICLAASMIDQYRGTIPKRVKLCKDIDNLITFAREYVVNILTAKQWTEHQNEKT
jgi:hypothetical protein